MLAIEQQHIESVESLMLRDLRQDDTVDCAIDYHLRSGGNRTRAKICLDAGIKLGMSPDTSGCLAAAVELLHNASLLHDDVQDKDMTRREQPSVWVEFGSNIAICAGDRLISKAFEMIAQPSVPTDRIASLLLALNTAIQTTISGQASDLTFYKNSIQLPDNKAVIEHYEEVATAKSAPLIALALELPLIASNQTQFLPSVASFVHPFAVAYQIVDDMSDYQHDASVDRPNCVNIQARNMRLGDAMNTSASRAKYLLKMAKRNATQLPNNIAALLMQKVSKLNRSIEEINYA